MADTLITPLNDSFVDFDVLGTVDATTYAVTGESHYAEMVRNARRQRRLIDGTRMDWIVVRNRLSMLGSRNKRLVGEGLGVLATRLGFRSIDGLAERVIYREFFPRGLTALDQLDEATLGTRSEHVSRHRARRGHEPDRGAEAAARCARPAAGGGARGVVRRARTAAGSSRPAGRVGGRGENVAHRPLRRGTVMATLGAANLPPKKSAMANDRSDEPPPTGRDRAPAATSHRAEIDAFLTQVKGLGPTTAPGQRGRLIFALDATMSRQPLWDTACKLQADMFRETAAIGGLDVQLIYYRGLNECRASHWVSQGERLADLMSRIDCRGGHTQIGKIIAHAKRETQAKKIQALVFVGDAMEEKSRRPVLTRPASLVCSGCRPSCSRRERIPSPSRPFARLRDLRAGPIAALIPAPPASSASCCERRRLTRRAGCGHWPISRRATRPVPFGCSSR